MYNEVSKTKNPVIPSLIYNLIFKALKLLLNFDIYNLEYGIFNVIL
jgi:hypothetical protein